MPTVITPASDDAPRDPGFTHTELRHLFLRATAKSPDGWAGSFMTMSDMGEREFAAATTTPFGDRLNEYGEVLLDHWNHDHPLRTPGSGER